MQFGTVASSGRTRAAVRTADGWRALPAPDLSAHLAGGGALTADGRPSASCSRAPCRCAPSPGRPRSSAAGSTTPTTSARPGASCPRHPTLFAKHADSLVGPTDDVRLPAGTDVDWEAELAVVVGAPLRGADREAAQAAIAGYTVANDVSVRDWQYRTLQWFQGKAWDGSTPVGPVVVTPDEVDPRDGLVVTCRVNGEEVQRDSTATLVFDAADLLAYISTFTLLRPGDLVLTGTPGGVGTAREPQRFLADGDVLETEIEGIGLLRNTIRLTTP